MEKLTSESKSESALSREASADVSFSIAQGPHWSSFEKLRVQGPEALYTISPHTVGLITTKKGQFRVLHEADFQHMVGLARDIDRFRQGMRVVLAAVKTVQKHQDQSSIETLVEAALLLRDSPSLPVRNQFPALKPETGREFAVAEDDEVELYPRKVRLEASRDDNERP